MTDVLPRAPERRVAPQEHRRASIPVGSAWMVVLSLLLSFIPFVNGLIGGLVGGFKVRGVKRALAAAVVSAAIVALGEWLLFGVLRLRAMGLAAGVSTGLLILASDAGLFLGAIVGGAVSGASRAERTGGWITRRQHAPPH
ncbi:MAG: hypothetical protein L0Y66_21150 [Myxococcaceae bacterium]|nr:hypothetical protein [Myxococcaceae bacterium]MCI0669785.1 hypothetical protein [Myxococcaceae bacterium]